MSPQQPLRWRRRSELRSPFMRRHPRSWRHSEPSLSAVRPTATRTCSPANGVPARSGDLFPSCLRRQRVAAGSPQGSRHAQAKRLRAPILSSPGPAKVDAAPIAEHNPVSPPAISAALVKLAIALGWDGYGHRYNTQGLQFHAFRLLTVNSRRRKCRARGRKSGLLFLMTVFVVGETCQ